MNLARRLECLERAQGDGGECPHDLRVVWPDLSATKPELCPICGVPRHTITVRYEEPDSA